LIEAGTPSGTIEFAQAAGFFVTDEDIPSMQSKSVELSDEELAEHREELEGVYMEWSDRA